MKIACIVGARPNFMKMAPILEAMKSYPHLQPLLVHTGQHYDYQMSDVFFEELNIPAPDISLGVGSGSHAVQTANIMLAFEPVVLEHQPNLVLVVGDVNSTLACALVAAKLHVPVAHVEAGLRSFDRSMPEEINRILTDALSDYLFVSNTYGCENLRREGFSEEKIFFVGNVMIDTLLKYKDQAAESPILRELGLPLRGYALMTLHRPHNVDTQAHLSDLLDALGEIQSRIPLVFVIHPRTLKRIDEFHLSEQLAGMANLRLIQPVGYLKFLNLMMHAKLVLTDSGGMQEETTALNVPCLTLRDTTERPETVAVGTSLMVGNDPQRIVWDSFKILNGEIKRAASMPPLWDGKAAGRIVQIIAESAG